MSKNLNSENPRRSAPHNTDRTIFSTFPSRINLVPSIIDLPLDHSPNINHNRATKANQALRLTLIANRAHREAHLLRRR
jgi:hypothetical protein